MKTLIILITAAKPEKKCLDSIINQGYEYHIIKSEPKFTHKDKVIEKYLNCSENRERARQEVLKLDYFFYLFLDDDVVLPKNAIENFHLTNKKAVGGWYKMKTSKKWVAGKWVGDNIFCHYEEPQESLIKVDCIGAGCFFVSKDILSKITFGHGTDKWCKDVNGQDLLLGECGDFSNKILDLGLNLYMTGDIICEHLERIN